MRALSPRSSTEARTSPCLVKSNDRWAKIVTQALIEQICQLPTQLIKSPTWKRNVGLSTHRRSNIDTNMVVYFCDPDCPWQRGTNKNTNGLLRQHLFKRTDLASYTQYNLDEVAAKPNTPSQKDFVIQNPG
ncbi:IS30 family transposase [Bordetella sp. LUAb4]|uniref:IS30 family transposase n=1 Tax=Bordetella sp. LUAb4 TaxID=2843195 RepID=UPI00351CF636